MEHLGFLLRKKISAIINKIFGIHFCLSIFQFQYSEFLSKLLSNGDEVFKSFDFTLKGDFSFPKQDVDLFKYSIHMLVGGILPMQFCKLSHVNLVECSQYIDHK